MSPSTYNFRPEEYSDELSAIVVACTASEDLNDATLQKILRRHPKDGAGFFSKSEIIRGLRYLESRGAALPDTRGLIGRLRMKPVRTRSGVAPVTVLTQPYPCPGQCVFCPSDVRMPKSYVSSEPGAQRAAEHRFDPYMQTRSRLASFHNIGHPVDKVELIVLGGTWSSYPGGYRRWFLKRCFDALNDFDVEHEWGPVPDERSSSFAFEDVTDTVDGATMDRRYNDVVGDVLAGSRAARPAEAVDWAELERAHVCNETAACRCVGLSLETRPDHLSEAELSELRRYGATKIQIGYQSLDDRVLRMNGRGHDVDATRRAMGLLRAAGFKIHAHWMPNLYGSSLEADRVDYRRIFDDPDFRPDELKIYPCSLLESAELMGIYECGDWAPYEVDELEALLAFAMTETPPWCRLTRVIRDIPSTEIVVGNRFTNLRQRAESTARSAGGVLRDIRSREVGDRVVTRRDLELQRIDYRTGIGREVFLQFVDVEDRLAGFLRLSLPDGPSPIEELGAAAVIREVHVYGNMVEIGGRTKGAAQHRGLGQELVERAVVLAAEDGREGVAVISAIGTRPYYRRLGFEDGPLFQHRSCGARP